MALSSYYGVARTQGGPAIPNAAVEVRRAADNDLATIFADAGGTTPINNGVDYQAGTDGSFLFYAEPDRYTVLVGSGASQVPIPAEIVDGRAQVPFEDRAAFVAWVAGGGVAADGTVKSDGTVQYVASAGATDIADLPGWLPFGDVTPEHFGAVGDGVTDDTDAFSDALGSKKTVICDGSKSYAVDDLDVGNNEALNLNGATLVPASSSCRWLVRLNGFNGSTVYGGFLQDSSYLTVKTATTDAAATAGDTSLSLADTSGLEAGMALAVGGATAGEFSIRKIASVAAGAVTFDDGLQSDVSSGATVYCSFGLLSVYSEGATVFNFQARDLRMLGGGVHMYQHGTPGSDISRGTFERIYSQSPRIAQEVIFNNAHDTDRILIQSWGDKALTGSETASPGQTTIDVQGLVGTIPIGAVFRENQVTLRVDGVTQTYTTGVPGAGEYSASSDGLTLTVAALTGGEAISLTIFERPFTSILYDPNGTGTTQGAHKWLRCLYLQNHSCALLDNENNSGGLLHFTQVNFDAGNLWGIRVKDTNKFFATHLFCGATPYPVIMDMTNKPDRITMFNGLWTAIATDGHFDTARVAAAKAITVNSSGPDAAVAGDGKPRIRISGWVGPDYTITDPDGAIMVGNAADSGNEFFANIRLTKGQTSGSPSLIHRSAGGTIDAPTAIQNGDVVAQWLAQAYNGTDYNSVGNIRFAALQNHSGTQSGTELQARVTAPGDTSTTQVANLRIDGAGRIRLEFGPQGSVCIIIGAGDPEGSAGAPVGSFYLRTDGGAGTSQYVKESGTGNTGWVAK